ncbi:MAG: type III-B CRISPR module RAMP protein Cmr6, partial [Ghiorsea sp.]|nr:type III-B CRISPR module RAMP protein Cmr6 [Ghiorsea sp.]
DWHFVTGMGNNHPIENGFAWHPSLGVPYLTGAAVKGMVRAWCEVWKGFDQTQLNAWFGNADQSGSLIFFDAIPIHPVQLKADIMTPHYNQWYAKGDEASINDGSNVPADWHDPVPVPFLVVEKDQSFQFGIAKRPGFDGDISDVLIALQEALQWLGAGAKTAAGYGRMHRNEVEEKKINDAIQQEKHAKDAAREAEITEIRRASMSPLERKLDEWTAKPANLAEQDVNSWLDLMESDTGHDPMRIARAMKAFFEAQGKWVKSSKKQQVKNQRVKRIIEKGLCDS